MSIQSQWQQAATAKNRRLAGAAEAARQTVIAANEEAAGIFRDLQQLERYRDELRRVPRRTELTERTLADTLRKIESLSANLEDARQYAAEVSGRAAAIQGIAERARKALAAVQGQEFFSTFGG